MYKWTALDDGKGSHLTMYHLSILKAPFITVEQETLQNCLTCFIGFSLVMDKQAHWILQTRSKQLGLSTLSIQR
jgi:hypothetical protein